MRDHQEELHRLRVKVAIVTFENGFLAASYVEDTGLEWPVLVDETRALYSSYGMLAASFWDVWGVSSWQAYLQEMLHGHKPVPSSGDIYQRGGDVLLDPDGIIRLHHIGVGPADRPSMEEIFSLIASAS